MVALTLNGREFEDWQLMRGNLPTNQFWQLWRVHKETMKRRGWSVEKEKGQFVIHKKRL